MSGFTLNKQRDLDFMLVFIYEASDSKAGRTNSAFYGHILKHSKIFIGYSLLL